MQPSDDCLHLIEDSESLKLRAYRDTGGVWTIGYGHTGGVRANQVIDKTMAETLLKHDLDYAVGVVNSHALPCTQSQFDALVDFVFNLGPTQFLNSHLYKYHVSGEYEKAAAEFPKWKYDNGKVEPGLVTRRAKEQALYTRLAQSTDRPHTDEQEHSVSSVADPVPPDQPAEPVQSSVAPPVPVSSTAPASGTSGSVFLSQGVALIRKLLGRG